MDYGRCLNRPISMHVRYAKDGYACKVSAYIVGQKFLTDFSRGLEPGEYFFRRILRRIVRLYVDGYWRKLFFIILWSIFILARIMYSCVYKISKVWSSLLLEAFYVSGVMLV